jgi:hypothetical protein
MNIVYLIYVLSYFLTEIQVATGNLFAPLTDVLLFDLLDLVKIIKDSPNFEAKTKREKNRNKLSVDS